MGQFRLTSIWVSVRVNGTEEARLQQINLQLFLDTLHCNASLALLFVFVLFLQAKRFILKVCLNTPEQYRLSQVFPKVRVFFFFCAVFKSSPVNCDGVRDKPNPGLTLRNCLGHNQRRQRYSLTIERSHFDSILGIFLSAGVSLKLEITLNHSHIALC